MKKILLSFSMAVMLLFCGISAYAANVDDSGMWEYQTYENGVELTKYNGTQTDIYIPKNIIVNDEKIPVFKIGTNIFENNETINSATIGEGIEIIGDSAFSGATNLTCIVSSESLTTIEANAFKDCTSFNSIIIYDTVSNIDNTAFIGCSNLVIYCNENNIGYYHAKENNINYIILNPDVAPETVIIDGITYYVANGETTIMSCDKSKSGAVILPLTVNNCPITKIRASAFADCSLITSVKIPESVRYIGGTAFIRCSRLSSVNIPAAVTAIYNNTFERTALKSIYLHEDIELVGGGAFLDCQSLTTVTLPKKINDLGAQIFWGCSSLQTIEIPDGVKTLGYQLFAYCYKINNIKIPTSVTTFESSSFDSCLKLTDIYYSGSRAQWLQINDKTGGYNLSNKYFKDATVHYAIPTPVTDITLSVTNADMFVSDKLVITATVLPEVADNLNVTWSSSNTGVATVDSTGTVTAIRRGTAVIKAQTSNADVFAQCTINVDSPHGTMENISWEIDSNKTLIISGEGDMPEFAGTSSVPWYNYRATIKNAIIKEGITSIGNYAFYGCSTMQSVVIPEGVLSIGRYAFQTCTILREITLPEGLKVISDCAFYSCNQITEIVVPNSVEEIGKSAFYNCRSLNNVVLSNNLDVINDSLFYSCVSLQSITIPQNVKTIGSSAFYSCTSLNQIDMTDEIETISASAFYSCTALTEISLPESLLTIGESAFYNCSALVVVYIPAKVTSIGNNAFYNTAIAQIQVSDENETYSSEDGVLFNKDKTILILYPNASPATEYIVPEKVVIIEQYAFYSAKNLETVQLPQSLIEIQAYAFAQCLNLKNIQLPESLQSLANRTFYLCRSLETITIPKNVKTIPGHCFERCFSLNEVIIAEGVERIEYYSFYNCNEISVLYIPDSIKYTINNAFYNCSVITVYYGGTQTHWEIVCSDSVLLEEGVDVHFAENLPVSGITISQTSLELPQFDTYYLSYTLTPLYPSNNTVIWESTDPEIANVQQNGAITTYKPGTTVITVTTEDGGYCARCTLTVTNELAVSAEGSAGSAKWTLCKNGTFIVSGYGNISNYEIGTLSRPYWYEYYNSIKKVIIKPGITSINISAFSGAKNLESVEIPSSVTMIGRSAFSNCTNLKEITIPKNVMKIDSNAFSGCTALKRVYIEDFERWCNIDFGYASSYYKLGYPYANPLNCGADLYVNNELVTEIVIPASVTTIKKSVFFGWKNLKKVTLHNNITSIGDYAFSGCSQIKDLKLPDSIVTIGEYAFSNCTSLNKVNIPTGITEIPTHAFSGCNSIEYIKIPNNITKIGNNSFYKCTGLKKLLIADSVVSIGNHAFFDCSAIKKTVIPENISEMYALSFYANTVLVVYRNSYAHSFAETNNLLYIVTNKTHNPEIMYGTEISGIVKYSDGTPAIGARVELLYDDGNIKLVCSTTNTGEYRFDYAEVGRYTIRVTDTEGNIASEIVSIKRMNVFDVYLAGDTNLILKKGYTVSGTVSPESAKVTIADTNGNMLSIVDTKDGIFAFSNITRGEYIVKAETENGSKTISVCVSNEDVTDIDIVVEELSSTIVGDTKIENRDGTYIAKNWVSIDLIDAEGNVVASEKTDEDGKYTFEKIPAGCYNIVAKTSEIRPAWGANYDKSFELDGYGYIEITEAGEYVIDTIILREEKVNLASISGQVTTNAKGYVYLTDENGNEIAYYETQNNGKFTFINIPDGMYCVTAITDVDGMGFVIVNLKNGINVDDIKIHATKTDKVSKLEKLLEDIPSEVNPNTALQYKKIITEAKEAFDSLPPKELKQASRELIKKLNEYINFFATINVTKPEGVTVENIESVLASDEIEETINFTLTVSKVTASEAGENGITTEAEYETEKIKDKKGKNKEIVQYYDITLTKDGQEISNIQKQTETNGKLLITMEIPEEYRGHKQYSFIHMHKGEAVTLVDLDDNPNTVTFEVDKFSTFALAYSDVELIGEAEQETYPASIVYNAETGKISVSSTENGTLYIATYNGECLSGVVNYDVVADAPATDYDIASNQAAFIWNENLKPLCEKFIMGN